MRIPRAAALLLLALCWHCREADVSEPAPQGPSGEEGVQVVPGSRLHRPESGFDFRPDSAPVIRPRPLPDQMGGGSQTETLTGTVFATPEKPEPGIRVRLMPANYDPSLPDSAAIRAAVTDDSGRFVFEGLDTATFYTAIAGGPGQPAWAFAESLKTQSAPHRLSLRPTSAFYIRIRRDDGIYATGDSGIAFFPGTDILVRCNSAQRLLDTIPQVPFGLERLVVRSRVGWEHRVRVPSEDDEVLITASPASVSIVYLP